MCDTRRERFAGLAAVLEIGSIYQIDVISPRSFPGLNCVKVRAQNKYILHL
jgi:hypothetical protein